jgi:glycine hydroxymethyltransferase
MSSRAVLAAVGSSLANKYAEGYPFKRYYQGQQFVDQVEALTIERAKQAFGVPHVNVQPLSGSPANLAAYVAMLKPGDKIMGLDLAHGGHLTHGSKVSASSIFFKSVSYRLGKDGKMDYDAIEKLAIKEKPQVIVAGITAYPLQVDWKRFAQIAHKVNAFLMADIAHLAGLVVGGVYPSPVPYAHIVTTTTHKSLRGPRGAMIMVTEQGLRKDPDLAKKVDQAVFPRLQGGPHINAIAGIGVALKEAQTARFRQYALKIVENSKELAKELKGYGFNLVAGGSNTHLILIDLTNKGVLGNTAAEALEAANIVLNRNSVPNDLNPPFYPSGIRMGTPGITTRGMGKKEMKVIAKCINDIIEDIARMIKAEGITFDQEKKASVRAGLIKKSKLVKEAKKVIKDLCLNYPLPTVY